MTRRRSAPTSRPDPAVVDAALAALTAEELRGLLRDVLAWLDERTLARLVNGLVDRAARNRSGWTPGRPSAEQVASIVAFAEAATRAGYADPSELDDHLRQGSNAFLGKDYRAASEIFRALLVPIGDGEIDLGQHEMVDEVLGVDVAACAAQHVISIYMTAVPDQRARAVRAAIDDVRAVGHFWEPIRRMERVAVEPLSELDDFLARWRALIEESAGTERHSDWDTDEDRWLREVVARLEGAEGLARVARSTRRAEDLRAWCRTLVQSRDWQAALPAYEEAAEITANQAYWRGKFLDGAALAAQELDRKDLPRRLERAWREAPSMVRLRRWLGSAGSKRTIRSRAARALEDCPEQAHRQRAFLHLLLGDHEAAARLLAAAPGLGWSDGDHPGHLLFPLFYKLPGVADLDRPPPDTVPWPERGLEIDDLERMTADPDEPRLATPAVDAVIEMAAVAGPANARVRQAVLRALRKAAGKRVAGVTENRRRRYYSHAAQLVAACAALDTGPEAAEWLAKIRADYRRYPALQRELATSMGDARP